MNNVHSPACAGQQAAHRRALALQHRRNHKVLCRDMVVMAAGSVSEYTTETLQKDGWKVHRVEAVQNPNMRDDGKYPARFWAVYTKLNVFNLIQYRKGASAAPSPRSPSPASAALQPSLISWQACLGIIACAISLYPRKSSLSTQAHLHGNDRTCTRALGAGRCRGRSALRTSTARMQQKVTPPSLSHPDLQSYSSMRTPSWWGIWTKCSSAPAFARRCATRSASTRA